MTDDAIIWDDETKMELVNVQCIMLGKQTKVLSQKTAPHCMFMSLQFENEMLELKELNKNDRLDLLLKIVVKLHNLTASKTIDNIDENILKINSYIIVTQKKMKNIRKKIQQASHD